MTQMMTTRFNVTLWDCGCLTWNENNEFTYLPCGQKMCRVEKVVRETIIEENQILIVLEVVRKEK